MTTFRSDDLIVREYVDLVEQYIKRLERKSFGDYQIASRLKRMRPEMLKVADRMVGLEPEDIDDGK